MDLDRMIGNVGKHETKNLEAYTSIDIWSDGPARYNNEEKTAQI